MEATKSTKISAKQQRFAMEYCHDRNGGAAFLRAFGSHTTRGPRSIRAARVEACKLLKNPFVQEEIRSIDRERRRSLDLDADRLLQMLSCIALFDPADVYKQGKYGVPVPRAWTEIPPEARIAIKSIKYSSGGGAGSKSRSTNIEYRFHDKLAAIEKLGRHLGLFTGNAVMEKFEAYFAEVRASLAVSDVESCGQIPVECNATPNET